MYSREDIVREMDALDWQVPDIDVRENRFDLGQGRMPLLFRGHNLLSPHSLPDENTAHVIHATPHFDVATSIWKFKLGGRYHNAPGNTAFVSTYRSAPDQRFYPDETLEHVAQGKSTDPGAALADIAAFDPVRHFETGVDPAVNELLAIYLYRYEGLGKNKQLAILPDPDSALIQMLLTNAKTPEATLIAPPTRSDPKTLRLARPLLPALTNF